MTTKLEVILLSVVLALIGFGLWTWHAERLGAAKCLASDATAVSKQVTRNATAEGRAGEIVHEEGQHHASVIATPVAPVATLGVQHSAAPLHCGPSVPAATAGPVAEADPIKLIRITGPTGDLRADLDAFDRSEVQRAAEADDQIAQLWDYATRVCPAPK